MAFREIGKKVVAILSSNGNGVTGSNVDFVVENSASVALDKREVLLRITNVQFPHVPYNVTSTHNTVEYEILDSGSAILATKSITLVPGIYTIAELINTLNTVGYSVNDHVEWVYDAIVSKIRIKKGSTYSGTGVSFRIKSGNMLELLGTQVGNTVTLDSATSFFIYKVSVITNPMFLCSKKNS